MRKTRKSIAKRFKVTGTGKVMQRRVGYRHKLGKRSPQQKRVAGKDQLSAPATRMMVKRALPEAF